MTEERNFKVGDLVKVRDNSRLMELSQTEIKQSYRNLAVECLNGLTLEVVQAGLKLPTYQIINERFCDTIIQDPNTKQIYFTSEICITPAPEPPTYAAEWKQARERFEGIKIKALEVSESTNPDGSRFAPACPFCGKFKCGECPWGKLFGGCIESDSVWQELMTARVNLLDVLDKILSKIPKEG